MLQGCLQGQTARRRTGTSLRYVLGERWEDAELPDRNFHHAEQQGTYNNEEKAEKKKQQLSLHLLDTQMCTLVKINP